MQRQVRVILSGMLLSLMVTSGVLAQDAAYKQAEANYNLAMVAMERGDYAQALGLIRKNRELDPGYWDYARHEGLIYWMWAADVEEKTGQTAAEPYYRNALQAYDEAIRLATESNLNPDYFIPLLHQRATVAADMGAFDEAIRTMESAIRKAPHDPISHYLMGQLLRQAYSQLPNASPQLVPLAQAYFKQAIHYNKDGHLIPYAYFYVGTELYNNQTDDVTAKRYLTMFIVQLKLQKGDNLQRHDREYINLAQQMLSYLH